MWRILDSDDFSKDGLDLVTFVLFLLHPKATPAFYPGKIISGLLLQIR